MDRTFKSKPTNVMFFDHGAGSLKVSIVSFHTVETKDKRQKSVLQLRVKAVTTDDTIGGNEFDAVIADMIISRAEEKTPGSTGSERAKAKIQKEAQKARTVLSANKEYQYSIEGLDKDASVTGTIKRSAFEEMAAPLFNRTLAPVKEALKEANVRLGELEAVELVGGAFRMPKVQALLTEYLPENKLRTSMNGEESAALGATFYAAYLAGYQIRGFNLVDIVPRGIKLTVGDGTPRTLFQKHSAVPTIAAESLKDLSVKGNFTVALTEEDALTPFKVWSLKPNASAEGVVKRLAYLKVDRSGLASLKSVEDLISGKESALTPAALATTLVQNGNLATPAMLRKYKADRQKWDQLDIEIRKDADARNGLEAFIFTTKAKVETEEFSVFTSEDEKSTLLQALDAAEEWLFDAGADAKAKAYKAKTTEVEGLLSPALFRATEKEKRPSVLKKVKQELASLMNDGLDKLRTEADKKGEADPEKATAITGEVKDLEKQIRALEKWLDESAEAQEKRKDHEDPVLKSAEMVARMQELRVAAVKAAKRAAANTTKGNGTKANASSSQVLDDKNGTANSTNEL